SLASHPAIEAAAVNLTATFAEILANETSVVVSNNSWSLEAFSVHDETPLCTNYHAALSLDAVNSSGTREVDGDSVYRLGSVTKIFTVLTWFVEAGDEFWYAPIMRFIPEPQGLEGSGEDPVRYVGWVGGADGGDSKGL
ncbi:hypothetical protein IMZ48_28335, partial [Candidatus Bathyarchaeota archaeon]|nr:hypothetical protein [Candidatus Bathyarchaeota archaeon]